MAAHVRNAPAVPAGPTYDKGPIWLKPRLATAAACVKEAGPVPWTMHFAHDEEVHFRALERLRALAARDDDRPWLLCVSYTHPHDPYTTTPELWERYAGMALTPPDDPPPGYVPHPMDRWVNLHHGVERVAPTREDCERARRGYYAVPPDGLSRR